MSELKVRIPVPLWERLRVANTLARLDYVAVPAPTTRQEEDKLLAFATFFSRIQDQRTLFGKELPILWRPYLVAVTLPNRPGGEYFLCIEGFTSESDIRLFHRVMSQSRYQYLYQPWKLCYEASKIRRPAGPSNSAVDESLEGGGTYCGRVVGFEDALNGAWISTIGGVIEVDGKLYAMTTAHSPPTPQPSDDGSQLDTLVACQDSDFPETVQPAYLIERDANKNADDADQEAIPKLGAAARAKPWAGSITTLEAHDLKLLPVSRDAQLPNYLEYRDTAGDESQENTRYVTTMCSDPSGRDAIVVAGVSGLHQGVMGPAASFLIERNKLPQKVWTMDVIPSYGKSGCPCLTLGCRLDNDANATSRPDKFYCSRGLRLVGVYPGQVRRFACNRINNRMLFRTCSCETSRDRLRGHRRFNAIREGQDCPPSLSLRMAQRIRL